MYTCLCPSAHKAAFLLSRHNEIRTQNCVKLFIMQIYFPAGSLFSAQPPVSATYLKHSDCWDFSYFSTSGHLPCVICSWWQALHALIGLNYPDQPHLAPSPHKLSALLSRSSGLMVQPFPVPFCVLLPLTARSPCVTFPPKLLDGIIWRSVLLSSWMWGQLWVQPMGTGRKKTEERQKDGWRMYPVILQPMYFARWIQFYSTDTKHNCFSIITLKAFLWHVIQVNPSYCGHAQTIRPYKSISKGTHT